MVLLDKRCWALLAIIAAVISTLMSIQLTLAAHAEHSPPPARDSSGLGSPPHVS